MPSQNEFKFAAIILNEFGIVPTHYNAQKPAYWIESARGWTEVVLSKHFYWVDNQFYPYKNTDHIWRIFRSNKWYRFYCDSQANYNRDDIEIYLEDLRDAMGDDVDNIYPNSWHIAQDMELYYS